MRLVEKDRILLGFSFSVAFRLNRLLLVLHRFVPKIFVLSGCVLSFLMLDTFLAFNHSIPSVKGTDAATKVTDSIIVRLTAVFHINFREFKACGVGAIWSRLIAPAVTTAWPDIPIFFLGTSLRIVVMVIV